jgi:imidazolonepropionase-like amidohydrolase
MITAVPAAALGWADRVGSVEAGKEADLLVVEGDPSSDIRALQRVLAVYKGGSLVSRA